MPSSLRSMVNSPSSHPSHIFCTTSSAELMPLSNEKDSILCAFEIQKHLISRENGAVFRTQFNKSDLPQAFLFFVMSENPLILIDCVHGWPNESRLDSTADNLLNSLLYEFYGMGIFLDDQHHWPKFSPHDLS